MRTDTHGGRTFRPVVWCLLALSSMFAQGCGHSLEPVLSGQTFDAGALVADENSSLEHSFRINNATSRPIKVIDVSKSCNCTEVRLDDYTIEPGGTSSLNMKTYVGRQLGNGEVFCALKTGDPASPDPIFRLKFRAYPRVRFEQGSVSLGTVVADGESRDGGGGQDFDFELYDDARSPGDRLESLVASQPVVLRWARTPDAEQIENGSIKRPRYKIHASYDFASGTTEPSGAHSTFVTARTAEGRMATMPISWELVTPLFASPDPFAFGVLKRESGIVKKLLVFKSVDGKDFRITSFSDSAGLLDMFPTSGDPLPTHSDTRHVLAVTISPDKLSKKFNSGEIDVATDHRQHSRFRILWSAILTD